MRPSTIVAAVAALIAILLLCPSVQAQTPPPAAVDLWRYVHPDAQFLAGLDWNKAKNSATGRMFSRQLNTQAAQFKASGPAFAMFERCDRILVSGVGRPGETPGRQPPMVVAVEGRIDRAEIKKLMPQGTAIERFKGVDLLVPPKSPDTDLLVAVVNDRTALFGDRQSLGLVLDARSSAAPSVKDTALLDRALQLSANCEVWLVSSAPASTASGAVSGPMKQLEDIESMDLGVSMQKGLGLRVNLITKSEDAARGFATLAQLISSMAVQDKSTSPEVAAIVKSLNVKIDGVIVHMAMDVPLAQLERGVASVKTSAASAGQKSLESLLGIGGATGVPPGLRPAVKGISPAAQSAGILLPQAPPQPPPPPQNRTIRIVGADGGDKEITYKK
ncbi:MAG: hypothetical protein HZB13_20980 [Acidobacteria bacterium]|nr:hypothetical protein [Acidobacteriota bacterium]